MTGNLSKRRVGDAGRRGGVTWKINSSHSTDEVGNIRCWPISTDFDGVVPARSLARRPSTRYSFIGYLLERIESLRFTSASSRTFFPSAMNTLCVRIWLSRGCRPRFNDEQFLFLGGVEGGESRAQAGMFEV